MRGACPPAAVVRNIFVVLALVLTTGALAADRPEPPDACMLRKRINDIDQRHARKRFRTDRRS